MHLDVHLYVCRFAHLSSHGKICHGSPLYIQRCPCQDRKWSSMVAKACAFLGLNTWFTTAGTLRSIKSSFDACHLETKVNQRAVYQAGLIDSYEFGHIPDDWTLCCMHANGRRPSAMAC
jgi:hypothetical protein